MINACKVFSSLYLRYEGRGSTSRRGGRKEYPINGGASVIVALEEKDFRYVFSQSSLLDFILPELTSWLA